MDLSRIAVELRSLADEVDKKRKDIDDFIKGAATPKKRPTIATVENDLGDLKSYVELSQSGTGGEIVAKLKGFLPNETWNAIDVIMRNFGGRWIVGEGRWVI